MTTDPQTIRNLRQQRDEWFRRALVLRRMARVQPRAVGSARTPWPSTAPRWS